MAIDATLGIRLLMLASVAASLIVPPKSVVEKRLEEEAREVLGEEEKRHMDHESFIGKDGAEIFDQMNVDGSKSGVGVIYDKIDKDGDGRLTEEEMTNWIKKIHKRQVELDSESYWAIYIGESNAELLTWDTFRKAAFGLDTDQVQIDETNPDHVALRRSVRHYYRLWLKADKNDDGVLNKEESRDFFFPEEANALRDVVADEAMEAFDENQDGYIGQEEYLRNVLRVSPETVANIHPEWLERERILFIQVKDIDKDGQLSREEVKEWLQPSNYDRFLAEAQRLIHQADPNQDGVLSKEEMTENYDKFVGSYVMKYDPKLHDEF